MNWVAYVRKSAQGPPRLSRPIASGITLAAALLGVGSHARAQVTITNLGSFSGALAATPSGVSADGTVVSGFLTASTSTEGFRWTSSSGIAPLGKLSGGTFSDMFSVSGDGGTLVGYADDATSAWKAVRWTSGGGLQELGTLGGHNTYMAKGVSNDGSVIVGQMQGSTFANQAFRWTSGGGITALSTLSGGVSAAAADVSADGNVVVGYSHDGTAVRAVRWTSSGPQDLGTLSGATEMFASKANNDGSVIVGIATRGSDYEAFRWSNSGGMVGLGYLLGGPSTTAKGVSGDGSIVVGWGFDSAYDSNAWLWTQTLGMVTVRDYLIGLGVNVSGWDFWTASGISNDGTAIVGDGMYNGNMASWRISGLSLTSGTTGGGTTGGGGAVPEPGEWAAMGILASGLAGLVLKVRRSNGRA